MFDEDTYQNHVFRHNGNVVNTQGNVFVELSSNPNIFNFEVAGLMEGEQQDQVNGYNKRERLLADAKTYSREFN